MKITKSKLRQIIKEESQAVRKELLNEAGEIKMRDYNLAAYKAAQALEIKVMNLVHPSRLRGPLPTTSTGAPIGTKYGGGLKGEIKDLSISTKLSIDRISVLIDKITDKMSADEREELGYPFEE